MTASAPVTGPADATRLIDAVSRARPMLGAILTQAVSVELDGERLRIGLPAGKAALARQLEQRESLELLEQHAEATVGRRPQVAVELLPAAVGPEGPPTPADAPPREAFAPVEPPPTEPAATEPAATKKPSRDSTPSAVDAIASRASAEPGIKKLLDTFGARIVDARPDAAGAAPEPHDPTKEDAP